MACTVGWISLGPMLLTVTRPVAAEGLDLGPPCEDRQWKAITLSAWVDGDNLCQLLPWKTQDAHATLAQALSLWHFIKKRKTHANICAPTLTWLTACCFTQQHKAAILPSVNCVLVPEIITGIQESPWRNDLIKILFIFYFSHTIMFGHTQGPP